MSNDTIVDFEVDYAIDGEGQITVQAPLSADMLEIEQIAEKAVKEEFNLPEDFTVTTFNVRKPE